MSHFKNISFDTAILGISYITVTAMVGFTMVYMLATGLA